jgi:hypothetical protein
MAAILPWLRIVVGWPLRPRLLTLPYLGLTRFWLADFWLTRFLLTGWLPALGLLTLLGFRPTYCLLDIPLLTLLVILLPVLLLIGLLLPLHRNPPI